MMYTSNGKEPKDMTLAELKEELRIQKWFATQLKRLGDTQEYWHKKKLEKFIEDDKERKIKEDFKNGKINEVFKINRLIGVKRTKKAIEGLLRNSQYMRNFEEATRLFILEIEDAMEYHKERPKKYKWIKPRYTPYRNQASRYRHIKTKEDMRIEAKKRILRQYETLIDRNGMVFQWDKKKLMMVARDRGYMSEVAVAYAIEQELEFPKYAVRKLLQTGKFTWGQVLVLGALFEMTPKEFCDVFLLGYFVECGGDWRASYDNIDKNGLLAKAVVGHKRKPKEDGEEESEEEPIEDDGTITE